MAHITDKETLSLALKLACDRGLNPNDSPELVKLAELFGCDIQSCAPDLSPAVDNSPTALPGWLPIGTRDDIVESSETLCKYASYVQTEPLRTAAAAVLDAAARSGVSLSRSDELHKYAGRYVSSAQRVTAACESRAARLRRLGHHEAADRLNEIATDKTAAAKPADMAALLTRIDSSLGRQADVDGELAEMTLTALRKEATDLVRLPGGLGWIKTAALTAIPNTEWQRWLGDDVVAHMGITHPRESIVDYVSNLPSRDVPMLQGLLGLHADTAS